MKGTKNHHENNRDTRQLSQVDRASWAAASIGVGAYVSLAAVGKKGKKDARPCSCGEHSLRETVNLFSRKPVVFNDARAIVGMSGVLGG